MRYSASELQARESPRDGEGIGLARAVSDVAAVVCTVPTLLLLFLAA